MSNNYNIYCGTIIIKKEDKKHYNAILKDINKGLKNDFNCIGKCEFSNGYKIYVDICSGNYNYYTQYVLYDDNGAEADTDVLDADLEDFTLVFSENKDVYKIHFEEV